ncbi:MAG: glutamate mutase L [Bacteroidales bacterium]|jgi:hypothetical protein
MISCDTRNCIDVGSTQIKIAEINDQGILLNQSFHTRDFSISPSDQVRSILSQQLKKPKEIRICSSANGGIRVGILALTSRFSGTAARSLALGAGANVVFTHIFTEKYDKIINLTVDTLIFIGGIDCEDSPILKEKILLLDLSIYNYRSLIYAGNNRLAAIFLKRFPHAMIVPNPFDVGLGVHDQSLLAYVRKLYLDDLIDKESIRDLTELSHIPILPTPGIVNIAFEMLARQKTGIIVPLPCIVIDIGGATTDVHFGVETLNLKEGMDSRFYLSSNRYVFTDLGVVASRSSTLLNLSQHIRLYEFLQVICGPLSRQVYLDIREGSITDEILFYGCFFLALDQLVNPVTDNVPNIDLTKLASIMITGGASKALILKKEIFSALIQLLLKQGNTLGNISVIIDKQYEMWVHGIMAVRNKNNN